MKNPKSNYIGEAWRLRRKRLIIRGIIAGAVILVVAFAIFFVKILNMKEDIDSEFTDTAASAMTTTEAPTENTETTPSSAETGITETTESSTEEVPTSESSEESSLPPTTESTQYTDETDASDYTEDTTVETDEDGNEVTTTTTISLLPDPLEPREPVLFPDSYPLQTVTHSQRDQSYAHLKHAVKKYAEEKADARIGFYYINLNTKEAFGYNEVSPFVVGSSIYLPLNMLLYDDVRAGTRSTDTVVEFLPEYVQEGVFSDLSDMPEGKQFFLNQLVYRALHDGDSVAMSMLLAQMGGTDNVLSRLTTISSGIDYSATSNYVDYQGVQQSGTHRSSPYDLAQYAEMFYWRYMAYPDTYQDMVDAMSAKEDRTGLCQAFPTDTIILHRRGTNQAFASQSDVAIILSSEPVIVSICVETEDPAEAQEIQAALGALVYNFISYCHA